MDLTRRRWIVLIAGCIINLCIGSLYAWSVFATPLAEHLNTVRGAALYTAGGLAIVFTLCNSYAPVPMLVNGVLIKKVGIRKVIFISGILFGLGMILCSFATSLALLIIGYSLFVGCGVGLSYGCLINNAVKFFPDKRGLIGGISTATFGLSSAIVPFIANALISKFDVMSCFRILGIAGLIIILGCGLLIVECPDDFVPDTMQSGAAADAGKAAASAKTREKDWRELPKDPIFWVMMALFFSGCFFGMMVISQASPIAQNMAGMTATAAASVVSVLAVFNVASRFICGTISDKIGRVNTLTITLFVALAGLAVLIVMGGTVFGVYAGISMLGFAYGSFLAIFPGFTVDQFGAKDNSIKYGLIYFGLAAGGFFGPIAMSKIYAASGSYRMAFIVAIAVVIFGLLMTVVFRILNSRINETLLDS